MKKITVICLLSASFGILFNVSLASEGSTNARIIGVLDFKVDSLKESYGQLKRANYSMNEARFPTSQDLGAETIQIHEYQDIDFKNSISNYRRGKLPINYYALMQLKRSKKINRS